MEVTISEMAYKLLPREARTKWKEASNLAWLEYKITCDALQERYEKATAPHWERYIKATSPTRKQCHEVFGAPSQVTDLAWRKHERAITLAGKQYDEGTAFTREQHLKALNLARRKRKEALSKAFIELWKRYMA